MTRNQNNTLTLNTESLSQIPVGCHLSFFYENRGGLLDLVVSLFKDGVSKDKLCFCISSDDLMVCEIKSKITETAPELNDYVSSGQIEVVSFKEKIAGDNVFDKEAVAQIWSQLEKTAKEKGLKEIRVIYNTSWLEKDNWKDFIASQEELNKFIKKHNITAVTTYALYWYNSVELFLNALNSCNKTVVLKDGSWKTVPSPRVDVPDRSSPLYEKYAQYVTSLEQIVNEILPWKEKYTVEYTSPAQSSTAPKAHQPQRTAQRKTIRIETKPPILKNDTSSSKKAKIRKGKKTVKKLLRARKALKKRRAR